MKKDKSSQASRDSQAFTERMKRQKSTTVPRQMIQVFAVHTDRVHCSILVSEGTDPETISGILGTLADGIENARDLYEQTSPRIKIEVNDVGARGRGILLADEIERDKVEKLAESQGLDLQTIQSIRKGVRGGRDVSAIAFGHGIEVSQVYDVAEDLLPSAEKPSAFELEKMRMGEPLIEPTVENFADLIATTEPQTVEEAGAELRGRDEVKPHGFERMDAGPGSGRCARCGGSVGDPIHRTDPPSPDEPHAFQTVEGIENPESAACILCHGAATDRVHTFSRKP